MAPVRDSDQGVLFSRSDAPNPLISTSRGRQSMASTYHIGALHAQSWAGLVLSPGPGEGFAFRFAVELSNGDRADGMDLFWLVHRVGPHAPDGRYARISFDLGLPFGMERETPLVDKSQRHASLTLEWSRLTEQVVVARVHTNYLGVLELVPFFPWDWEGQWAAPDLSRPLGSPGYLQGRTASGSHHLALFLPPGVQGSDPAAPQRIQISPGGREDFVAAVAPTGEEARELARRALLAGPGAQLAHARESYESARVHVDGPWEGLAASVTNNLHWMVLLKPETGELYVPAGRRWIFPAPDGSPDHWTVFGWDSYFNALELAVESPELAGAAIRAGLPHNIPRGASPTGGAGSAARRTEASLRWELSPWPRSTPAAETRPWWRRACRPWKPGMPSGRRRNGAIPDGTGMPMASSNGDPTPKTFPPRPLPGRWTPAADSERHGSRDRTTSPTGRKHTGWTKPRPWIWPAWI